MFFIRVMNKSGAFFLNTAFVKKVQIKKSNGNEFFAVAEDTDGFEWFCLGGPYKSHAEAEDNFVKDARF